VAYFSAGCVLAALAVIGVGVAVGILFRRIEHPGVLRWAGATIAAAGLVVYLVPAMNDVVIRMLE